MAKNKVKYFQNTLYMFTEIRGHRQQTKYIYFIIIRTYVTFINVKANELKSRYDAITGSWLLLIYLCELNEIDDSWSPLLLVVLSYD